MAEGRILSKRVSRSDKVAALSSDTSRMLYSWLIPYLDVEGRMESDPRLLKADIAPLLDHITPKVIEKALSEFYTAGLVVLYFIPSTSNWSFSWILLVAAGAALTTGLFRFCGLYSLLGISTCPLKNQPEVEPKP